MNENNKKTLATREEDRAQVLAAERAAGCSHTAENGALVPLNLAPEETMLDNHNDLRRFLERRYDIASKLRILTRDKIGFTANLGPKRNERFDFPFNSGAFYEILNHTTPC